MNHSLNQEKYTLAELEDVKLYVSSYELSRERKLSFANNSVQGLYLTDHGTFPSYLKLKGVVLLSECSLPCVSFHTMAQNNVQFFFYFDGMFFSAAKLKSYNVIKENDSDIVKCEVTLCCQSCTKDPREEAVT